MLVIISDLHLGDGTTADSIPNGYSRTRTAEALAISKKTLYLKSKRYGLKTAD